MRFVGFSVAMRSSGVKQVSFKVKLEYSTMLEVRKRLASVPENPNPAVKMPPLLSRIGAAPKRELSNAHTSVLYSNLMSLRDLAMRQIQPGRIS